MFKKWLKKIVLFPLSIIMGVGDGEGEAFNPDTLREIAGPGDVDDRPLGERIMAFAGAPEAQFMVVQDAPAGKGSAADADQSGNQGDTDEDSEGLDTQSDEDGQDADLDEEDDEGADDSTGQETDESDEDKGKGTKKRTFEERAREIAEKIVEERLAKQKPTTDAEDPPDWVPVNQEKVDAWITEMEEQIDALRLEGKYSEARKLSRQIDATEKDLEENEGRRIAWLARQEARKQNQGSAEAARKELDGAAELYRAELKIEQATWDRMGKWFESQIETKPLLVAEFNDIYAKQGKVAAIRFAHEYTVKNMGQTTKKANEQKEKSKTKAAALTATTTGKAAPIDLKKAQEEFAANPSDENFVKLQALKRQARGA